MKIEKMFDTRRIFSGCVQVKDIQFHIREDLRQSIAKLTFNNNL